MCPTHMHEHVHTCSLFAPLTCLLEVEFPLGRRVYRLTLAPLSPGQRNLGGSHQLRALFPNYEKTHPPPPLSSQFLERLAVSHFLEAEREGANPPRGPTHQLQGGERHLRELGPLFLQAGGWEDTMKGPGFVPKVGPQPCSHPHRPLRAEGWGGAPLSSCVTWTGHFTVSEPQFPHP